MLYLLDRRIIFFALLFLLYGCAKTENNLNTLYENGVLAMVDIEQTIERNISTVTIGDLIQTRELELYISFPRTYEIYVLPDGMSADIWNTAIFSGLNFGEGDSVKEDDLLAHLYIEPDPALVIRLHELELEIARFEASFEREERERRQNRTYIGQLEYEQFIMRSEQTREWYNERLEDLEEQMTGRHFYSPIDGVITSAPHVQPMTPAVNFPTSNNSLLARIVDLDYFYFVVWGELDILRMGSILEVYSIHYGPDFGFEVQIVSDPLVTDIPRLEGQSEYFLLLPVDYNKMYEQLGDTDMTVFNASGTFFVRFDVPLAKDAVLVDRWAVNYENNRAFVWLYENGEIRRRFVEVGATAGEFTQILTGLIEGQEVVIQ